MPFLKFPLPNNCLKSFPVFIARLFIMTSACATSSSVLPLGWSTALERTMSPQKVSVPPFSHLVFWKSYYFVAAILLPGSHTVSWRPSCFLGVILFLEAILLSGSHINSWVSLASCTIHVRYIYLLSLKNKLYLYPLRWNTLHTGIYLYILTGNFLFSFLFMFTL